MDIFTFIGLILVAGSLGGIAGALSKIAKSLSDLVAVLKQTRN
jgi:hypothetical protein